MARYWWVASTCAAVVVVVAVLIGYELLVVGPQGASAGDMVESHLFVAAVAAVAGATATAFLCLGPGPGTGLIAIFLGTAAGGGVAASLAAVTGNGPDEGDGFLWLMVASLLISLLGAGVATLVATRLRPRDVGNAIGA